MIKKFYDDTYGVLYTITKKEYDNLKQESYTLHKLLDLGIDKTDEYVLANKLALKRIVEDNNGD